MIFYKLVSSTYEGTGEELRGKKYAMESVDPDYTYNWYHLDKTPELAELSSTVFIVPDDFSLWETKPGGLIKYENGIVACTECELVQEVSAPDIRLVQRVEITIRAVKLVCDNEAWNRWADDWLSDKDRTYETAAAAHKAAAGSGDGDISLAAFSATNAAASYLKAGEIETTSAAVAVFNHSRNEAMESRGKKTSDESRTACHKAGAYRDAYCSSGVAFVKVMKNYDNIEEILGIVDTILSRVMEISEEERAHELELLNATRDYHADRLKKLEAQLANPRP